MNNTYRYTVRIPLTKEGHGGQIVGGASGIGKYKTYEEALKAGLFEALKLLP